MIYTKKIKHLPIKIIDGDRSSRYPKRSEFREKGVLFLNTTNIVQNRLDITEANFVSPEKFNEIKKGRLQRFDIVMTARGSIGKVALFDCNPPEGLINAQMLILRADGEGIDQRFLFYQICSDNFQTKLKNFASGSAQPQIPIIDLQEIEIAVPDFSTQCKIAAVLSAYDDLIENNTRRIEILEEMASAIYREWFVEFRFPGHEQVPMVESELGLIPQGWEVKQLGEIVSEIIDYRGKTPKKLGGDWAKSGIMALSAMNVKQGRLVNLEKAKFISEELYKIWMKSEIAKNDILMTSEAPFGEVYYLAEKKKICLSQRLFCIRG